MRRQPARSRATAGAPRAAPKPSTSRRRTGNAADTPEATPKPKSARRGGALQLAAEIERLTAELAASRARLTDLEARIDVDPLTETFNRRGFERELKRSLAYVKRYGASAAVIFIDLDEFKPINDRHGHAAGDAVLKAAAMALMSQVRASDIVARIGGDEFVVLLWNISAAAAAAKAAALEEAISTMPVRWGSTNLLVGASAGVALIGALDTGADALVRADAAMYERKYERKVRATRTQGRR